METVPLLGELAIVGGVGVLVTALLARLRLPTVAGLLAAGALVGPSGLGLVDEAGTIEVLAEVGVVLLLFTIGLEFSLDRLRHIFRRVALGGLVQVAGTTATTALVAVLLGRTPAQATFLGFVVALSSTAIVLRALTERGELDAPHGRFIVGTLIFQDLCVVPMVLLVPVLGRPGPPAQTAAQIALALGMASLVVALTLAGARLLVPRLLRFIVASQSRELFLLAVLAVCVGTAWLTSLAGLSLALGAFLGGMVVADSEFQHRAMGDVIPLRDAFVSLFFVSLGMLFDVRVLLARPLAVAFLLLAFLVGKAVLAFLAAGLMRFPARAMWLAGVGLAQFGEFGFVLVRLGLPWGLISEEDAGTLLAAGVLSMFLTPLLIRLAPRLTAGERLLSPLTRLLGVSAIDEAKPEERRPGQVVVIGYGVAGKLLNRVLAECGVPRLVLELNAETVRAARAAGDPVLYADATSAEALDHAGVAGARAVVVLINDPAAVLRVVDTLRRVAPDVPVLVRTRYLLERDKLLALGAADVVTEEVEASIEVVARLLRRLEVPGNLIDDRVREARASLPTSDRRVRVPRSPLPAHSALAEMKIESLLVRQGRSAAGRSLAELDVRRASGALVVAVRRGESLLEHPDPGLPLETGDVVYLVGSGPSLRRAAELLDSPSA